jgi:uncharacterized protein
MSRPDRMSAAQAVDVLEALEKGFPDAETISIHFYGGEPLLNLPAMRAIVEHVVAHRKKQFSFAVTTNGTMATPEIISLLDRGGFGVVLSVDGPAEVHNACRGTTDGSPTHHRVLKFLKGLREKTSCWVRGSAVVRPGWPMSRASAYLKTLPVDTIKCQVVRARPGSPWALNPAERQEYLNDLEAAGQQVIEDIEAGVRPRDDRFTSRVLQILKGTPRRRFCGAGTSLFGITPNGAVLPCILMDAAESALGSIYDADWRERGRQWAARQGLRIQCTACPALPLCGGGCPALTPFCGDSECEITRKNCEVAVGIYERFRSTPEKLLGLAGL